ncbi:MAG: CARDB domain-containing protein [Candidatus Thermoplasmatota archaeon]
MKRVMPICLMVLLVLSAISFFAPLIVAETSLPEDDPMTVSWDGDQDNYTTDVSTDSYSVVGIKTHQFHETDKGFGLETYDNQEHVGDPVTEIWSGSPYNTVFSVIDGRELSSNETYYPIVREGEDVSIGDEYTIEYEGPNTVETLDIDTPQGGEFISNETFDAYQVELEAGTTYNITVDTPVGSEYPLYLLNGVEDSVGDSTDPDNFKSKGNHIALSASTTDGATQEIVVTPTETQPYCIAVLNRNGFEGSYDVSVRTDFDMENDPKEMTYLEGTGDVGDPRVTPESGNYTMEMSTDSYSVVGIQPHQFHDPGEGFRLETYDNQQHIGDPMTETRSTSGSFETVFSVIDGRELTSNETYYPVVKGEDVSLGDGYTIEYEGPNTVQNLGINSSHEDGFTSDEVFDAYQVELEAGTTYNITLDTPPGSLYPLYLLDGTKDSVADSTYPDYDECSGDHLAVSASTTDEATQEVVVTPTETQPYSIVVLNRNGFEGSYDISVRTDFDMEDDPKEMTYLEASGDVGDPRVTPENGNYTMEMSTDSYSMVGIKTLQHHDPGEGFRLDTYDNHEHIGDPMTETRSTGGSFETVFSVIDGRELSTNETYYPVVKAEDQVSLGDKYTIEYEGPDTVETLEIDTSEQGEFASDEVFDAYQVELEAGKTYNITLDTPIGSLYPLYLLDGTEDSVADSTAPAYVECSGDHLAVSASTTDEATQEVVVTPTETQPYSIVVLNRNGFESSYDISVRTDFDMEDDPKEMTYLEASGDVGDPRVTPENGNYTMEMSTDSYSVVGIKTLQYHDPGEGFRLDTYDNHEHVGDPVTSTISTGGNFETVFSVIDGRELSTNETYYPVVKAEDQVSLGDEYTIEYEGPDTVETLEIGTSEQGEFSSDEIFDAYDVKLTAGATYNITLDSPDISQYNLYLLNNTYNTISNPLEKSEISDLEEPQNITFVPEETGYYNIVSTNPSRFATNYTISVDLYLEPANFSVEIISPEEGAEISKGEEVAVEYTIENIGETEFTEEVGFLVDDELEKNVELTLAPGEEHTDEFIWTAESVGEYRLKVASEDDIDEVEVAVIEEVTEYELTIETEEGGTTDPDPGTYTHEEGEEVVVEAIPDEGWNFVNWTGDYEGTEENITMVMDENKTITAHFEEELESYALTVTVEGEGSVDVDPDQEDYEEGTEVTLTAVPAENWTFIEWTGDHEGENDEITVTMDSDKTITAHFEEEVIEEPYFEVEIIEYDDEVVEGEDVAIDYVVTNTGEVEGIQDILLTIGDEEFVVEENLGLSVEEEYQDVFVWETEEGDEGTYDISIESEDDQHELVEAVKVEEKEELEPANLELHELLVDGEPLKVTVEKDEEVGITAEVENLGDMEGEVVITIYEDVDGDLEVVDSQTYTIEGGEVEDITEEHVFDEEGNYVVELSEDEMLMENVMVEVEDTVDDEGDGGDEGILSYWWIFLILAMGLVLIVILAVLAKGRDTSEDNQEDSSQLEQAPGGEKVEETPPPEEETEPPTGEDDVENTPPPEDSEETSSEEGSGSSGVEEDNQVSTPPPPEE